MGRARTRLSAGAARRVALAAQGFGRDRPGIGDPPPGSLLPAVRRLGLLQLDSVNVLARAHYLPLFARLGPYPRESLDAMAGRAPRRLFEYWAHAACLLPVETQPLLRWRMDRARDEAWGGMRRVEADHPGVLGRVLSAVADVGPATAGELELAVAGERAARRTDNWGWNWSAVKRALEMLFWSGEITSAGRRGFERRYDLPERVLPAAVLATPTPDPADARRELVRTAARALGVASAGHLADYFRLRVDDTRAAVADLVESGDLVPVEVAGWRGPTWLDARARVPRSLGARALLAPFDPLVFERSRVQTLFGMQYRIEIYTRPEHRVYGYYVLPFLLGDRLVGRVDLKADRSAGLLRLRGASPEPGLPPEAGEQLLAELRLLGDWLGVPEVVVATGGPLADAVRAAGAPDAPPDTTADAAGDDLPGAVGDNAPDAVPGTPPGR